MPRPPGGWCWAVNPTPHPPSPAAGFICLREHQCCHLPYLVFSWSGVSRMSPSVCGRGAGGEWRRELLPVFQVGKLRPEAGRGPGWLRLQGWLPVAAFPLSPAPIRAPRAPPHPVPPAASPRSVPPGRAEEDSDGFGPPSFSSWSRVSPRPPLPPASPADG